MVSGLQILSRVPNTSLLISMVSRIASITISASAQGSKEVVPSTLAIISSLWAEEIFSFSTSFARFFAIFLLPISSSLSLYPFITTGKPAWAKACTIPLPIVPVPTTAIFI